MKKILFVISYLLSFETSGQPGFNQVYGFEQAQITGSAFANVILDEDTLVIFGICFPPVNPPTQQGLLFVKMDTSGNVLLHKCYLDTDAPLEDYAAAPNYEIIKTSDGGYALTGSNIGSGNGLFVKLSFQGGIEFYKKYNSELERDVRKVIELEDGYFLSGWKQLQNFDLQVFLMKVDKQGNFLWEKTYGEQGIREAMLSLVKIDDNCFAIGAEKVKFPISPPYTMNNIWIRPWLVKVDSLGNVIQSTIGPQNLQGGMGGLQKMEKGWLYGTIEFSLLGPYDWGQRSKIVRTGDDINDLIWERYISETTYPGNTVFDIKPTPSGDWVAVGQWITPIPDDPNAPPNYQGGSTFQFTSDGDSLWARLDTAFWHPDCGSENYLGGVAVLPSGSIIAAGYANSNCFPLVRSYGWVLKISKDGCIDTLFCGNTTPVEEIPEEPPSITASPNPASGDVTFAIEGKALESTELTLNATDLNGKTRWSQRLTGNGSIIWNTATVPNGIYVYRLASQDGRYSLSGKIVIQK